MEVILSEKTEKQLEDLQLIQHFKDPEKQSFAFHQLLKKYQQRVYWMVRKMVIDHEDANDITQDVFIKVWQHLEQFRGESKLYTWIYRIAVNETTTFLAKKRRRFFFNIIDVEAQLSHKLMEDHNTTGDMIQLKLQQAILTLPEKQRLIFNMKYFDELKYEDIAEITGTSVGALKASFHHAVQKIEKYMKASLAINSYE
jgi:RNA polymerase sigma-70 factor (ECF subfamily)